MNTLTDAQRERILGLLREGKSLRRIEHETGHRRETIAAYGRRAGLLDETVTSLDDARATRREQTQTSAAEGTQMRAA